MSSRIRQILSHPVVKVAYLVLLFGATAFYLLRWGGRVPELAGQVRPVYVAAALLLTYLSALLYSFIQHYIYRRLGAQVNYWTVFRIVSVSQLGKYLPGKVFFLGNFYLFSREAGIGNLPIGASFSISMALWIVSASLCGLPVLSLLEPRLRYSILILPVLILFLIHPRFLGWLLLTVQTVAGRIRRSPADPISAEAEAADLNEPIQALLGELGASFYAGAAFLYLAAWALTGLAAYLSIASFQAVEPGIYPLALASIALGTVAGFLALFAPVGLGVREGIGTLILSPAVGAEAALLAMLLLRGMTTIVDLSLALLVMLFGRRAALGGGQAEPTDPDAPRSNL